MTKRLINNTASPVTVNDTGITVPASGFYDIPPTDYPLWAASSNVVTFISDLAVSPTVSTLTVFDGSANLNISDGVDWIKGIFPAYKISTPITANVSIPTKNLEQSYSLPSGTLEYRIKTRHNSKLQLAYTSGQSGTTFVTIWTGMIYERRRVNPTASLVLYFQASKDNEVLEIEAWT